MSGFRVVAFLQLYNESSNGHLERCLTNCSDWADEIFIYDDGSTDGSHEVYWDYTDRRNVILGERNDFNGEIAHKAELLKLALSSEPDWIGWIDGDDTLDRYLTENLQDMIEECERMECDGMEIRNLNLWKHPAYARMDSMFNDCLKVNFWKNTGYLHYANQSPGLHRHQHPDGITNIAEVHNRHLLHYGFSDREWIIQKYLTYKSLGQSGWPLNRLIDEITNFDLVKVPEEVYPANQVPEDWATAEMPLAEKYNEIRRFASWDEYLEAKIDGEFDV